MTHDLKIKKYLTSALMLICTLPGAQQLQRMPTEEEHRKAMQAVQKRAASVLDDAERQSQPNAMVAPRIVPQADPKLFDGRHGVDPAIIAEKYKDLGKKASDNEAPELIVFVSLSMPEEALRRIGQQAKQAGAVLVFRGLKNGLRKGAWTDSMNALRPVADTGADVQIHPELFSRYNVTEVPTLVVAATPQAGCQDDACAAASASVVGDVTMEYALDLLTGRKDAIGKIARDRIRRLRNS